MVGSFESPIWAHMKPKLARVILLSFATVAIGVFVGCMGCSSGSGGTASGSTGTSGTTGTTSGGTGGGVAITGAGSTFVNPAMSSWAYTYHGSHADVTINYQSVGSGAGISQYQAGTVDFGASDAPLSDKDLAGMPSPTVQFPVVAGGTALAYNIPGIGPGLKLSDDVLADIFLGKIKTWNDPRLVALNADQKLPATAITVAHRSDGSGTTYIFTDYLCAVSPAWKSGPGMGKSVNWPVGTGGKGTEGVAGLVKATPGSIGYVELAYAVQTKMNYAQLKNKSGAFVSPSVDSTAAAVAAAADALKKDVRSSIVNEDGKDSYPIAGMTYVILSKTPKDKTKAAAIVDFMKWVLGDGQNDSKKLQYAPLPAPISDLGQAALAEIQAK